MLAETKSPKARYIVGKINEELEEFEQAFKAYLEAAEAGIPKAMFEVAMLYLDGNGVERDNEQALKWFHLANENKVNGAPYYLGHMYRHGIGCEINLEKAIDHLRAGAKAGDYESMVLIGA